MEATKAEIENIVNRPYTIEVVYPDDASDGVLARVAEWPGCMSAGDTREAALERIGDAMRDWVETRLQAGLEIPAPITHFGGKVLVQMPKSLHRDVVRRAQREGVSMNQLISTTLARAMGPVESTVTSRRRAVVVRTASRRKSAVKRAARAVRAAKRRKG